MIIVFFSKFIIVHRILIRNICLIKILLMNKPIYNFSIWLFLLSWLFQACQFQEIKPF